jgi:hypothetical protein
MLRLLASLVGKDDFAFIGVAPLTGPVTGVPVAILRT